MIWLLITCLVVAALVGVAVVVTKTFNAIAELQEEERGIWSDDTSLDGWREDASRKSKRRD